MSRKRKVGRQPPDYFDKIKQINDRFACIICEKTFSLRKDCGRHIASIHLRETTFPCEYCGQHFCRKDKVRHHIKRMHSDKSVYPKGKRREWMFGDRLYSKPTGYNIYVHVLSFVLKLFYLLLQVGSLWNANFVIYVSIRLKNYGLTWKHIIKLIHLST